jgi:hypothetical protein
MNPVAWAQYIDDGLQMGKQWDRISEVPRSVRASLEISRRIGNNLAMPHVLRGDEGPRHLDPRYIARLFNCHSTIAARLAEQFATFEFGESEIRQFATVDTEYGGPLGLAFYLETLALKADIHPAIKEEQITFTALPQDEESMDENLIHSGHYEPVAYHKLEADVETREQTPLAAKTSRTAWPQWVRALPEWTRQLIAALDYSRERAYEAANLMGQRGAELNSSARQWIWNLIKDRIAAHKPGGSTSPTSSYDFRLQAALIERADTQARLNELASYITVLPEQIKAPLRELWIKRRDILSPSTQLAA